jgi:alkylated DNA repair dioxygenase AlkB
MKLKGLLGALAPTLVKTVASSNPIAGMAVKLAARKLGMPETSTIEQIEEVVENEPEKAEVLQDAELEIKKLTANIEGFRLETEDRQDARKTFAKDPTPKVIAVMAMLGFLAYIFMVTLQAPESNDDAIVNLVLGYLGGLVSGIASFYFGSSHNGN